MDHVSEEEEERRGEWRIGRGKEKEEEENKEVEGKMGGTDISHQYLPKNYKLSLPYTK